MARGDIMPFRSPNDEDRLAFPIAASQTFLDGEPVVLTAAGALNEAGDDPAAITGIAAEPAIVDTFANTSAAVGTPRTIYGIPDTVVFRTNNFATDGAGTAATPTQANIGDLAGLTLTGGNWFLDTGCANLICVVDDVLDQNKFRIASPNTLFGTATTVLFRFL